MDPSRVPSPPLAASLKAGVAAASVGVLSFHVFHTLWISDVPAVLVEGAAWALVAGSAAGWAFHEMAARARVPAGWRGGVAAGAFAWLLLAPYEIIGFVFGPFTHLTRPVDLASMAPVGLVAVPFAALVGWKLTRERRPTVALAVATLLTHFMFGGSLVFFGGRGVVLLLWLWMLPTFLVAGLVLVAVRGRLARAAPPSSSSSERSTPQEVRP